MDDDDEGDVDLGLALSVLLGVQLAPYGNCAVLCAAWLRTGRFDE